MPKTALTFTDRDELADFLTDGEPSAVADYLDTHDSDFAQFLSVTSGATFTVSDIETITDALRKGNQENISDFRNFISDCIQRNPEALPLSRATEKTPQIDLPQRAAKSGSWLRKTLIATPIIVAAGFVTTFIDFGSNEDYTTTPNDSAELAEPFNEVAPSPPQKDAQKIAGIVENAVEPDRDPVAGFDDYGVEGLYQDSDNIIYYQDWLVPNDVYEANVLTSQITGMPLSYSLAVQALESSMNPRAFNGIKACGLSQFVPETLAEVGYRFSPLIGYEGIQDALLVRDRELLERTDENGGPLYNLTYDYASNSAQHNMIETCWDPHFNTRLAAVMQIREIGSLQRDLAEFAPEGMDHYPVTELQGYIAHFAGGSAGENIIHDLLGNDGESLAREFFSSGAVANSTNQRLLFHPKTITNDEGQETQVPDLENPRTVAEFFAFLEDDKGLSNDPDSALPDFTNWEERANIIEANMSNLGISPVTIIASNRLAYSPTPAPRPTPPVTQ